jgi:flagellar basal-body rod protein FlgC
MNSIASIALSGLQAATQRLDIASNNIANAATPASTPQRVDQQSLPDGGVGTSVSLVDPALLTAAQSDTSAVAQSGLETAPNVDLVSEIINQKSAFQAYQASAQLVRVSGELDQTLLDSTGAKPRHV